MNLVNHIIKEMLQSLTILSKLCFACDKKQLEFEGGREGGTGPAKVQSVRGSFLRNVFQSELEHFFSEKGRADLNLKF